MSEFLGIFITLAVILANFFIKENHYNIIIFVASLITWIAIIFLVSEMDLARGYKWAIISVMSILLIIYPLYKLVKSLKKNHMPNSKKVNQFMVDNFTTSELLNLIKTISKEHYNKMDYGNKRADSLDKEEVVRLFYDYCERHGMLKTLCCELRKLKPNLSDPCDNIF